jgi:fumarylacetoacetate (FAA) hydrolase
MVIILRIGEESHVKLCTFVPKGDPEAPQLPGVLRDGAIVRLECASLIEWLTANGDVNEAESHALEDVRIISPIPVPPSIRDFFAFEQHVMKTRGRRGEAVPEFWYSVPVFYFTNPAAVIGSEDVVAFPRGSEKLDYELEVAAVIGGDEQIAGFTILNDWSARDLQRGEITVGLGPAKGKDFATSIGPFLVTVDEFDGGEAVMLARVNGQERSRGQLSDIHYSWLEIRDRAAMNTRLRPGDVLGSGTVGTGCILESEDQSWLQPGDVVELEVTGLGVLRNVIGERVQ